MRESVLVDMGDLSAPMGSLPWVKAVHEQAKAALNDAKVAKEQVQVWVNGLQAENRYRLLKDKRGQLFMLWEKFCTTPQPHGLGYSPEAIDGIIAERKSVEAIATEAVPLKPHGAPERNENASKVDHRNRANKEKNKGVNNTFVRGSTNSGYLSRRIARDRPDILERMKVGEFRSVRAAAIEAGIVKPTITIPAEPKAAARSLLRHFKGNRLQELIAELQQGSTTEATSRR